MFECPYCLICFEESTNSLDDYGNCPECRTELDPYESLNLDEDE